IIKRSMTAKRLNHVNDSRLLLSDSYVYAFYAIALLVNDRIDRNSGFTCLTVTNDQLALSAANWNHRVNRFNPGLHRLMNRFPVDNTRRIVLNRTEFCRCDRSFSVDRLAKRVHDAAQQGISNGHLHDLPGAFNLVTFTNIVVWTQNNNPDV